MDALGQIANALFNDMVNDTRHFALVCLVGVYFLACDAERVGAEPRLRDEIGWKWNAEEASDTSSEGLGGRRPNGSWAELASLGDQE